MLKLFTWQITILVITEGRGSTQLINHMVDAAAASIHWFLRYFFSILLVVSMGLLNLVTACLVVAWHQRLAVFVSTSRRWLSLAQLGTIKLVSLTGTSSQNPIIMHSSKKVDLVLWEGVAHSSDFTNFHHVSWGSWRMLHTSTLQWGKCHGQRCSHCGGGEIHVETESSWSRLSF